VGSYPLSSQAVTISNESHFNEVIYTFVYKLGSTTSV
jgi:hypothetical protein